MDQRPPILRYDPQKHISWVEFHGGSTGGLEILLGSRNSVVIRDNSCQIEIFEKIMKNVFYVEFHGESNGAIHFRLRHRNHPQNAKFRSLDSFCDIFYLFWIVELGFRDSRMINKSVMEFECDLSPKSSS